MVADRYDSGDLRVFKPWAQAYVRADIWVECRVNLSCDDPDLRILAYRAGESGFLASQRPGEDVVDVFELSPYELGIAVAASAELVGPGARSAIVIPGYLDRFRPPARGAVFVGDDDYAAKVSVRVSPDRRRESVVPAGDVAAMTTVQTRCVPSRGWGVDWGEQVAVCVRVVDDGDYLFGSDLDRAVPVTVRGLADRIDSLIADDVVVLRRRRGIG